MTPQQQKFMELSLETSKNTLTALKLANEQGAIADTIWLSKYETLFDYLESQIDAMQRILAQPEQECKSPEPKARRLHEENRKLRAQQALDRKAENARELGLDYEPEQEPCGGCGGSGWVPRDPDIGTDQECFVCGGSGAQPEQDWIERERAVGYREGHQNALKQMAQPEHEPVAHWSGCAVHNEPAYPKGECDCGGYSPEKELFDSARSFYNATVADLQVRITSKDQNKRDVASEAANRLRNALLVYKNTTPPQRKPLSNEEITQAFNKTMAERPKDASNAETNRLFVRAIEAAHGIKEKA